MSSVMMTFVCVTFCCVISKRQEPQQDDVASKKGNNVISLTPVGKFVRNPPPPLADVTPLLGGSESGQGNVQDRQCAQIKERKSVLVVW